MLDDGLFQKISDYLCIIRDCIKPFGGVQMVLCGDLLQLPPIDGTYCIKAPIWSQSNIQVVVLTEVHRQKDPLFLELLAKARVGDIAQADIETLVKKDVQFINELEYERAKLKTTSVQTYHTSYHNNLKSKVWAESMGILGALELCVGAQVMVTMNIDHPSLINGTRGIVTQLGKDFVEIKTVDGQLKEVKIC
jgi:ATP-dependent DNA helicase PIF1